MAYPWYPHLNMGGRGGGGGGMKRSGPRGASNDGPYNKRSRPSGGGFTIGGGPELYSPFAYPVRPQPPAPPPRPPPPNHRSEGGVFLDLGQVNPRARAGLSKAARGGSLDKKDYYDLQVALKETALQDGPIHKLITLYKTYLKGSDVDKLLDDPSTVEIINNYQEGQPLSDALLKDLKPVGEFVRSLPRQPKVNPTNLVPRDRFRLFDPRPLIATKEILPEDLKIIKKGILAGADDLPSTDLRTLRTSLMNRMYWNLNPFPLVSLLAGKLSEESFKRVVNENTFDRLKLTAQRNGVTPREFKLCMEGLLCPGDVRLPGKPEDSKPAAPPKQKEPIEYDLQDIPGVIPGSKKISPRTKRWMESVVFVLCRQEKDPVAFLDRMGVLFGTDQVDKIRNTRRMQKTMENAKKRLLPEPLTEEEEKAVSEGVDSTYVDVIYVTESLTLKAALKVDGGRIDDESSEDEVEEEPEKTETADENESGLQKNESEKKADEESESKVGKEANEESEQVTSDDVTGGDVTENKTEEESFYEAIKNENEKEMDY